MNKRKCLTSLALADIMTANIPTTAFAAETVRISGYLVPPVPVYFR